MPEAVLKYLEKQFMKAVSQENMRATVVLAELNQSFTVILFRQLILIISWNQTRFCP